MPEIAPLNNRKILPSNFYVRASRNSSFYADKNKYVPLYGNLSINFGLMGHQPVTGALCAKIGHR
jgi:hypothetical protein